VTAQQSAEALEAELEEAEAEAGIEREESDKDVDEVGAEESGAKTEE
jgi:large subunit ribosomal protein L25